MIRCDVRVARALVTALLLLPGLAVASVGRVVTVEGTAWRTPEGAERQALQSGTDLEQKDTLDVDAKSGVKLELNDGSVLMLSAGSQLVITEAQFAGQERKSFSGYLKLGKVWAEVKKALSGSEAKFEVKTDRAVAGVRGTVLRVDAAPPAIVGALSPSTVVQVYTGVVRVVARVPKPKTAPDAGSKPGERHEVPGPQEVSLEEWEEIVRELQKDRQIEVGDKVGPVTKLDTKRASDAFGAFVKRNGGLKKP